MTIALQRVVTRIPEIPEIPDPYQRHPMKGFIQNIEQVTALYGGLNAGRPTSIVFNLDYPGLWMAAARAGEETHE